jgi:hypothetical protein
MGFKMPRFYFHVRSGQATILDHRGLELVDRVEAAKEGVRRALQIEEGAMEDQSSGAIIVDDEFSTLLEVPTRGFRKSGFVPLP